jgi:enterochelin esterase family protein
VGSCVAFELIDRSGRLSGVRLQQEIGLPGPLDFVRTRGTWRLTVDLPDVDRLEYLFEVRDANGARITIPDPGNPRRAPGAFGEKSVLELDGYEPPGWLAAVPVESTETSLEVDAPELDGAVELTVWAPAELAGPAPLIVVHDGPEYASLAALTQFLGTAIAARDLPPLRAALVAPGERNAWYSANPAYARALCEQALPALADVAPADVRIGIGASLGGLAMLHAQVSYPDRFDGLLLQSSSFFTPDLDPQESDFSGFAAVSEFVAAVHAAETATRPVPATLTCGTVEENLANNELMTASLHRLGYRAQLHAVRDAHNYTAWRDALDPHLPALLAEVVAVRAA